ncbi:MFS transporter [Streptomyces sp. NPDC050617]|uniref:MFS transporter n=1 Tax=Streptomyces sp. NPDC050617 TaxID=3154628 RepID=UPI003412D469
MGSTQKETARRRGATALYAVFFINGLVLAGWAPRIPQIKADLGLTEAELGLALLGVALGSLPAMAAAGVLVNRFGSHTVVRITVVWYAASIVLPGLARNLAGLVASLTVLGAAVGSLDVAMNTHAVEVERGSGRSRMSSFHGLYSAGALAGALLGTACAALGLTPLAQFAGTAVVTAATACFVGGALRPVPRQELPPHRNHPSHRNSPHRRNDQPRRVGPYRRRPRAGRLPLRLLLLSALGLSVLMIEGAMTDWGSVYLAGSLHAGPGVAGTGYAVFALAMMAGRLGGDRAAGRLGPARTVRYGAVLSGCAALTALAAGDPVVAVAAYGVVGLGIAASFPLVVSGAGRYPSGTNRADDPYSSRSTPGTAVATVTSTGYLAFLAGPPLIGSLASAVSLRAALLVVPALAVTAVCLAPLLGAGPDRGQPTDEH